MGQLQSLEINFRRDRSAPTVLDLSAVPRLSSLKLENPVLGLKCTTSHGFLHLTTISCKMSLDGIWSLLHQCSVIENVNLIIEDNVLATSQEVLSLQRLIQMRLASYCPNNPIDPGPLLDRLHLPALIHLEIMCDLLPERIPSWPHLTLLLQRSQPLLQSLEIGGTAMTVCDVFRSLQLVPQITYLNLDYLPFNGLGVDDVLKALTFQPSRPTEHSNQLCPLLERFTLTEFTEFSTEALATMLLSRWRATDLTDGSHLQDRVVGNFLHVHIQNCKFSEDLEEYPGIADAIEEGLQLTTYNNFISWYVAP